MLLNIHYKYCFSIARILLGIYLIVLFAGQWLDREILFFKFLNNSETEINFLLINLFIFSIFFTFGIFRRFSSAVILTLLIIFLQKNVYLYEIHFGYIGWMLVFFTLSPSAEPFSIYPKPNLNWNLPSVFYHACLLCLGSSYTASGLAKHFFSGWNSGEAIKFFFQAGLCKSYICEIATGFSQTHFIFMTYFVGIFELISLPAVFFVKTRPFIWFILTIGQFQMLFTSNIFNISIAVIIFHILCFNPDWISAFNQYFKYFLSGQKKHQI